MGMLIWDDFTFLISPCKFLINSLLTLLKPEMEYIINFRSRTKSTKFLMIIGREMTQRQYIILQHFLLYVHVVGFEYATYQWFSHNKNNKKKKFITSTLAHSLLRFLQPPIFSLGVLRSHTAALTHVSRYCIPTWEEQCGMFTFLFLSIMVFLGFCCFFFLLLL